MSGAASAAAPALPTAEALVAAIPGFRIQENWRDLVTTYFETKLAAPLLEKLLGIDAEDATALLNTLTTVKVKTVGSLIDAAGGITVQNGVYTAVGDLAALNAHPSYLQRIAILRDKVKQAGKRAHSSLPHFVPRNDDTLPDHGTCAVHGPRPLRGIPAVLEELTQRNRVHLRSSPC